MRRRDFIALAGAAGTVSALPRVAFGQATKVPRVAVLSIPLPPATINAFEQGLSDFGYVVGKTIAVDFFTDPTGMNQPSYAAMAVASRPDAIWAMGSLSAQAAKDATKTIPVVFYTAGDPVDLGLIQSLAHPGGNLTGSVGIGAVGGKLLEFLRAFVPDLTRTAVFQMTSVGALNDQYLKDIQAPATALGIDLTLVDMKTGEDFRDYFDKATAATAQAIYVFSTSYAVAPSDGKLFSEVEARSKAPRVIDPAYLTAQNNVITNGMTLSYLSAIDRIPLVSAFPTWGNAGALIGYGPDALLIYRRAGYYIDAVLRGTKPADLAVELPTNYKLTINLKTAKAIGVAVPSYLMGLADELVQ